MNTINISLPEQLKSQAQALIKQGQYASFSDLVRDALRRVIEKNKYDIWTQEVKEEFEKGQTVILKTPADIQEYMENL